MFMLFVLGLETLGLKVSKVINTNRNGQSKLVWSSKV